MSLIDSKLKQLLEEYASDETQSHEILCKVKQLLDSSWIHPHISIDQFDPSLFIGWDETGTNIVLASTKISEVYAAMMEYSLTLQEPSYCELYGEWCEHAKEYDWEL